MTLSCSVCGFQRDDRAFYRRARSGFLNLPRRVCGGCLPDRPTREDRATLAGFVLPQALWLIPIAYASQDGGLSGTSLVVAAAVSVLSLPVRVLIHELGHALMARVVGAGAVTVSVGGGPERRSLRWAGIRFRLHAYPFAGGRTTYWLSTSRFRWRDAAVLVAGAGANVASGLAAVLLAYLLGEAESSAAQLALGGLTGFAVSSLWLAARSLMPTRGGSTVAHLPSDGWLLLQLLKPMLVISERDERVARVRTLNLAGLYEDVARESLEAALLPSHSVWLWSAALAALSKSKGHRAAVDCYLVHRLSLIHI